MSQEVTAGIIGGTLACWNHPFEVARIEAQARAAAGEPSLSMVGVMKYVVKQDGFGGLFKVAWCGLCDFVESKLANRS